MTSVSIEKVTFPIDKIQASLKIHGLYAIPEEWKTTDQANPGLFTYAVRMSKFQILKGKICPRQLTQKEKRELEQKNKKGGKKQSKNPQPNEEQERLKKIEEQRQKQREQLFAKMSQEEQFHYNSEDIYRSPFLKFEENVKQCTFQGNDCLIFQERLLKDKGDWIYIYKMPAVSQDELAKMRKSKPKTLNNINDLNPVVMRAWISFQELTNADNKIQIKQLRCKIHQVDKTPQTPEPNLQRTYAKLSFSLSEPIVRQKDSYSTSSLINDPEKLQQKLPQEKALDELKQEIGLAIQSLAMEFSTMFWKDLNLQEDQRHTQIFLNNKKGQLSKRKQQFLYDFNITGKYKILKDRIKKCIVHLCQTKYKQFFVGMKSFNGIKCNNQDQIYSEIYNLLVVSYQDTIFKIIHEKQQSLGEVLVLKNQTIKMERQGILNAYRQENLAQRVKRTTKEYELILDNRYGEQALRKYIEEYPELTQLKYLYGTYCLKYNLKPAKQVLPFIEQYLTKQKFTLTEDKKIQFMLILLNSGGQNYLKGWIILRQVIDNSIRQSLNGSKVGLCRWLLLASVILKNMGQQGLAQKYKSFALREYKKIEVSHQSEGQNQNGQKALTGHKQSPLKSQIPTINSVANYAETGIPEDINSLYDNLIQCLGESSAFELIKIFIQEKPAVESHEKEDETFSLQKVLPEINQLLVGSPQSVCDRLLQLTLSLYQNSSSIKSKQEKHKILQLLIKSYLLKININKSPDDLKAVQGYLKKSLMTNNNPINRFVTLLRLGYVYYLKQEFGNARACLLKYLQKSSEYPSYLSGLSYKLLGISCLKLGRINDAIQNFKHWNLSDIKNKSVWLYLALAYAYSQQLIVVNQCLTQYNKRCQNEPSSAEQNEIMSQISAITRKLNEKGQYEGILKAKILQSVLV